MFHFASSVKRYKLQLIFWKCYSKIILHNCNYLVKSKLKTIIMDIPDGQIWVKSFHIQTQCFETYKRLKTCLCVPLFMKLIRGSIALITIFDKLRKPRLNRRHKINVCRLGWIVNTRDDLPGYFLCRRLSAARPTFPHLLIDCACKNGPCVSFEQSFNYVKYVCDIIGVSINSNLCNGPIHCTFECQCPFPAAESRTQLTKLSKLTSLVERHRNSMICESWTSLFKHQIKKT